MARFIIIAFSIWSLLIGTLQAQTTSWIGGTDDKWRTDDNWTNGKPDEDTDAIIGDGNFTGPYEPTISRRTDCKSLTIGNDGNIVTLTINNRLRVWGNLLIGANGSISHTSRDIVIYGDWTNNGTFTSSNKVKFSASGIQTIGGTSTTTFDKVEVGGSSVATLASNIVVDDELKIRSGEFDPGTYTVSGNAEIKLQQWCVLYVKAATYSGNYANTGGLSYNSQNCVIEYASSSLDQTIDDTISYRRLRVSGGMTKTAGGNLTISNELLVDAGTLDLLAYTANRTSNGGRLNVVNGATLKIGGTNSFPSNYSTVSIQAASTIEYYGGDQAVGDYSYGNLILSSSSGSTTKTLPTDLVVRGNFSSNVTAGDLTCDAVSNVHFFGDVTIGSSTTFNAGNYLIYLHNGDYENNGTYNSSGAGQIRFQGANAVISGSGTNNFPEIVIVATGVTMDANTSATVSRQFGTWGGSFTHTTGGSGTITMDGNSFNIRGDNIVFDDLIIDGTIASGYAFEIAGNFTVNGTYTPCCGEGITLSGTGKVIDGTGSMEIIRLVVTGSVSTAIDISIRNSLTVEGTYTATAGTHYFTWDSTFSGEAQMANIDVVGGRTLTLGNNAILKISGTEQFNGGNGIDTSTNTPNTIEYNSSGAQTPSTSTFLNLILSNGDTKTASEAWDVNGDLTIASSTTFDPGSYTHTLAGNWTNSGTFSASTSTIELDGASDSQISGATTFNDLTVNKGSVNVVTLNDDITVDDLAMTAGKILAESDIVTVTNSRTGNGIIIGTIQRTHAFTSGTNYAFEGPNNYINFSSITGTITSIRVSVDDNKPSSFPYSESIIREYDIDVTGGTSYNALLRLHYEDVELSGNDESLLTLWNDGGTTTWVEVGKSSNNSTDNWVEETGITDLQDKWSLCDGLKVLSWTGTNGTSWTDPGNWTVTEGSPGATPGTDEVAVIGDLSFSNHPVITTAAEAKTIYYESTTASTLTIGASGSLSTGNVLGEWTGDSNHSLEVGAQNLTVNSDIVLSDGTTNRVIDLSASTGTITLNGKLVQTGGADITFTGAGSLNIGEDFDYTSGTFTPGSSVTTYDGSTNQKIGGVTYNDLTIAKSAGTSYNTSAVSVNGDLNITTGGQVVIGANLTVSGDLDIGSGTTLDGGSGTISVGGHFVIDGTFAPSLGTFIFNGTGAQNVPATTFNNFEVNKSSGIATMLGDIYVNDQASVLNGELDVQNYNIIRTVTGGTALLGSSGTIDFAGSTLQVQNFETITIDPSSTCEFSGTTAQSVPQATYGNLIFSNGGSNEKTIDGTIQVMGDFTINSGATVVVPESSLHLYGDLVVNGTLDHNDGTIVLEGTDKTIDGTITFNNTIVNGSFDYVTGAPTFDSLLHVTPTGDLDFGSVTVVSNGDLTNEGILFSSGTVTFSGTREQNIRIINALTSTSAGVINFNGTVAPIFDSNFSPTLATANINNTGGFNSSVGLNVLIAMNIGAGVTWDAGAFDHNIKGHFINNGTVTASGKLDFDAIYFPTTINLGTYTNTGITEFGGTQALTLVHNAQSFGAVVVSNTHADGVTPADDWSVTDDLRIDAGATLKGGTSSHSISGQWTNNGTFDGETSLVTLTSSSGNDEISGGGSSTFNDLTFASGVDMDLTTYIALTGDFTNNATDLDLSRGSVEFSGSGLSVIGGSTNSAFEDLEIDKSSNGVRIDLDTSVDGILTLTNGQLDLNANILTISSSDASALDRTSGYILSENTSNSSVVTWSIGSDTDEHVFPFGTAAADYIPFTFDLESGDAGNVSVATYPTASDNTPYPTGVTNVHAEGEDNSANTVDRFFQIGLSGETNPSVTVTFSATSSEVSGINDLKAQRWDGSAWDPPLSGQSSTATSVTVPNVTSFSPWAISGNGMPLPVELVSFKARLVDDQVLLSWTTATEKDNDRFEMYKSYNGADFERIGTIDGAGDSNEMLHYNFTDSDIVDGENYYQLKQIDHDGSSDKSKIIMVMVEEVNQRNVTLYPNPSNGNNLRMTLGGYSDEWVRIRIISSAGTELLNRSINVAQAQETRGLSLDNLNLQKGTYIVEVLANRSVATRKLLVK